ncbi:MAG: lamin tail domain-containing protein [Saprospiraceae bacterium]
MKRIMLVLSLISMLTLANSQIVINEIMFNPPESGTDNLEYIEFYNAGNQAVNLKDYSIKDAVVITFPDTTMAPNAYFIICVNSLKFDSVFGFPALEWTSGGLRNTDEVITLLDANQNPVDSVHYFGSWNTNANGNGASLELCRANIDNNLENYWGASKNAVGVEINGKFLFASPNAVNSVSCADYTINASNFKFDPDTIEIFVGEKVEWLNKGGHHNINGSKSVFTANPESFGNGLPSTALWSYIYKFNQPGIYNYQCDVHASNGMKGTVKVKIKYDLYPSLPIGIISSTDFNGLADSLNRRYSLEGVVYGVNLRPIGLQFTLIDQFNDGIAVFLSSGNLAYTVTEGDLIRVKGLISQFNGLIQMIPDSITKLSVGNSLFQPTVVNYLNESTESQLIQMKKMELVDPGTWSNNPLGFTVKVTDGTNTFDMRIDNDVNIHGTSAPVGKFDLTGLGSQFDAINPFLEGYQIQPRYLADIKLIVDANNLDNESVKIYPNPVENLIYFNKNALLGNEASIYNAQGKLIQNLKIQNPLKLDLSPGVYFMSIAGEKTSRIRFIKL